MRLDLRAKVLSSWWGIPQVPAFYRIEGYVFAGRCGSGGSLQSSNEIGFFVKS